MASRLRHWDYATSGAYFITACTHERRRVFGTVHRDAVRLSPPGEIAQQQLIALTSVEDGPCLDTLMVMPDHVHAIILITHATAAHYSALQLVSAFKARVTSEARRMEAIVTRQPLWQRSFFDRVIRTPRELDELRAYIATNPTRWTLARTGRPRTSG